MKENAKLDLLALWSKDKDTVANEKAQAAIEELRVNADNSIMIKKRKVIAASKAFKSAVEAAKDNPNFDVIDKARVAHEEAVAEFNYSVNSYEMVLGDKPAITLPSAL